MPKIMKNGTTYGSSPAKLNEISDVTITSPQANQLLARNSSNTAWINKSLAIEAITPSYIHPNISNDNAFLFYKKDDMLIVNGVFRGADVPRYTTLYTLSNIKVVNSYIPFIQYGGGVGYLGFITSGNDTNVIIANSNLTDYQNYNCASGVLALTS